MPMQLLQIVVLDKFLKSCKWCNKSSKNSRIYWQRYLLLTIQLYLILHQHSAALSRISVKQRKKLKLLTPKRKKCNYVNDRVNNANHLEKHPKITLSSCHSSYFRACDRSEAYPSGTLMTRDVSIVVIVYNALKASLTALGSNSTNHMRLVSRSFKQGSVTPWECCARQPIIAEQSHGQLRVISLNLLSYCLLLRRTTCHDKNDHLWMIAELSKNFPTARESVMRRIVAMGLSIRSVKTHK